VPLVNVVANTRAIGQRNEPCVVNHFLHDRHVALGLEDLKVAVVAGHHIRRAGRDTSDVEAGFLGGLLAQATLRVDCGASRLRFGRQWDPPIGRLDDQRRAVVEIAFDYPEGIVVACSSSVNVALSANCSGRSSLVALLFEHTP